MNLEDAVRHAAIERGLDYDRLIEFWTASMGRQATVEDVAWMMGMGTTGRGGDSDGEENQGQTL